MSPELDTYSITKRVKEVLTDNNLGTGYRESGMLPLALLGPPPCLKERAMVRSQALGSLLQVLLSPGPPRGPWEASDSELGL